MILGHHMHGQIEKVDLKFGVYGSYADESNYQELTIKENHQFEFYNRVELGSSTRYKGKWKIERNKLILYKFKNNRRNLIPEIYILKNDQLCPETIEEICFKWADRNLPSNQCR